jgi:hypothetical protein
MTAVTDAAHDVLDDRPRRSREGARLFDDLMAVEPEIRRGFLAGLDHADRVQVLAAAEREGGTMYALWEDDALGFVLDVLGENVWSKSSQLLAAIPRNIRTAVPSCFSSSKSWSVSRAVLWKAMVHPPSTVKVITIAPVWRQVERIIWPEIRGAHARSGLPGVVDNTQLKVTDSYGTDHRVAYGIAANPYNEAAVQGIHAPHLLLVVDEAGGIGHTIGENLRALLTGSDSRMIAIGNPPSDDEGSWFEGLCTTNGVEVIRISAYSTPAFTDERVGLCRSCPPEVAAHSLAIHLVQRFQVDEAVAERGEDSPWVQAKVHARFPKGGSSRVIPSDWVDAAMDVEEPEGEEFVRLSDLGLQSEQAGWMVERGAWVRLGVDVAADGGDEFVIGRAVGDLGTVEHVAAGLANAKSTDVAGVILQQIRRAQLLRQALGTPNKVRVKIDVIGVGWGVYGLLKAWGSEGLHDAEIVKVDVRENTYRKGMDDVMRPYRKRDEMWVAGRHLVQPGLRGGTGRIRLRVDARVASQLAGPQYGTGSHGFTVVESKDSMRKRGLRSPDRAEALLMAYYEPKNKGEGGKSRIIV